MEEDIKYKRNDEKPETEEPEFEKFKYENDIEQRLARVEFTQEQKETHESFEEACSFKASKRKR